MNWIDGFNQYLLIMETSPFTVKGSKFRVMLGAWGLRTWRVLYRATPAVTQGLGFLVSTYGPPPFNRLIQHARGYGGSILIRIFTGPRRNKTSTYANMQCYFKILMRYVQ
jgi:hypothetical protein